MISMAKETKLAAEKVVEKAVAFFGPSGIGLEVVDRADCCVRLEGAGGYVFVQAAPLEDAEASEVSVEGREWEVQIKHFVREI